MKITWHLCLAPAPVLPPVLPVIVIPSSAAAADRCPDYAAPAIVAAGGQPRRPAPGTNPSDALRGAGGLFIPDATADAAGAAPLLRAALAVDLPILLTGRGMHLLNAVSGGHPAGAVDNHYHDGGRHQIYLSPGSKVAAIIGSAGMFRVNSRHRLGLREPRRADRLMSIAYQLDDGIIEGLESRQHSWVIAVQFLPERRDEVPALFNNLFLGLVERADDFSAAAGHRQPD